MNLTNSAQRVLEFIASKDYEAEVIEIYEKLRIDKTLLIGALYRLMQNGVKVTMLSDSNDLQSIRIVKTRMISRYLKGGEIK